ncbi:hypothetical protein DRO02_00280 [archaeon]|nr:MAG: hypothetical protein DRN89_02915 [archaeon]RLG65837.1 MAG: hypothetical protein DRO21_01135 [archaeon]RLG66113.1 MAG: hypothetical protein DRO02_00280 [archaeon]HDM23807.1 AmmeMemoRadiSam system protein B [Candidatus Bathyarchaeota archaeon]
MQSDVRYPAQAGTFYESDPERLKQQIIGCFKHRLGPGKLPSTRDQPLSKVIGIVSPHAGYMYSGPVAAHGFLKLAEDGRPKTAIILGPNHTGLGSGVSIMADGKWYMPFGDVEIDREVASKILENCDIIDIDVTAHMYEHSIEVQIPFLQFLYGDIKIVPICMMLQDQATSTEVGTCIYQAVGNRIGKDIVIIASSDFTHYEPHEIAYEKDMSAIERILQLNIEEFFNVIRYRNISVCGPGPIGALMAIAREFNAKPRLLKWASSGDVVGYKGEVVGYASIIFEKSTS